MAKRTLGKSRPCHIFVPVSGFFRPMTGESVLCGGAGIIRQEKAGLGQPVHKGTDLLSVTVPLDSLAKGLPKNGTFQYAAMNIEPETGTCYSISVVTKLKNSSPEIIP
jgi:hypothetical protein